MTDEFYMKRALQLARRAERWVSPNPMVGSVIVAKGRIIAEGCHRKFGGPHAETEAVGQAKGRVRGSTIYVTLEPCSHFGKTPPCVDKLIEAKPARVVIGTADPNPLVAGRGIEALNKNGIKTTVGVLEEECRELNERFFTFMKTGIPFVTLKFAQTIDGRIATARGHSRWISSPASRKFAHHLRSIHDAILVGSGTILKDDPELTTRLVKGRNPLRVVLDSRLRIPLDAKVLTMQERAKTIIATTGQADREKLKALRSRGVETILIAGNKKKHVDLRKLLALLGKRQISSLLVEGGSEIITAFVKERLADRMVIITAPKILGKGTEAVGDLGKSRMDEAEKIIFRKVSRKGDDIIIDALCKSDKI